jgi:hypothetical protein
MYAIAVELCDCAVHQGLGKSLRLPARVYEMDMIDILGPMDMTGWVYQGLGESDHQTLVQQETGAGAGAGAACARRRAGLSCPGKQ